MVSLQWTLVFVVVNFILSIQLIRTEDLSPSIYYLHIKSDIKYRFATTLVTSKVVNPDNVSREVVFDVTLPNEAFMSNFTLEINGTVHVGEVKEKEAAKQQYERAKQAGQSAGYIGAAPRETNKFNIRVNVESMGKVTFNLTYQEILRRKVGKYCHVVYVDPGQPVEDLQVEVAIHESRDITTLNVPPLRNDILTDVNIEVSESNDIAIVQRPTPRSAYILYSPSVEEQKRTSETGIAGQFVVEYDVDRQTDAGDLLVVNGYFVHFFAAEGLEPLPKDVLFILDKSGSMNGRKIRQLKDAMTNILDDVQPEDRFNIMTFDGGIRYWIQGELVPASTGNINNAKAFVNNINADGSTNIDDAMTDGLRLLSSAASSERARVLIFLTDGQPTAGEIRTSYILENICRFNEIKIPVFSLAFGQGADYNFVKKMAAQNYGFGRKIYEDSDADLQIRGFYDEISTVLMTDVTFTYLDSGVQKNTLTQTVFNTFFEGTEILVAGRLADISTGTIRVNVSGESQNGLITLTLPNEIIPNKDLNLIQDEDFEKITEKLWAYLTIKQKLKEKDASTNETEQENLKKEIIDMSLKYNFVTPLTSMVVTLESDSNKTVTDEDLGTGNRPKPHYRRVSSGTVSSSGNVQNSLYNPVSYNILPPRVLGSGPGLTGLAGLRRRKFPSGVLGSLPNLPGLPGLLSPFLQPTATSVPHARTTTTSSTTTNSPQPTPTTQTVRRRKANSPSAFIIKVNGIAEPLCLNLRLTAGEKYKILEDNQTGTLIYAEMKSSARKSRRRKNRKSRNQISSVEVLTRNSQRSWQFQPASYSINRRQYRWGTGGYSLNDVYPSLPFGFSVFPVKRPYSNSEVIINTDVSNMANNAGGLLEKIAMLRGNIIKRKTRRTRTIAKMTFRINGMVYKFRARLFLNPAEGVPSCWWFGKRLDFVNLLNIQTDTYIDRSPSGFIF